MGIISNFVNFLQYSWQCYLLVSKLSNFVDAYLQNFWFAVVSCMLLIKSRLYSFSKKTPYKKEQSYALLDLETVENKQSILTLPKRKLSNNNSIHDYSSKRKRRCGHFNWGFQFGRKRVDKLWKNMVKACRRWKRWYLNKDFETKKIKIFQNEARNIVTKLSWYVDNNDNIWMERVFQKISDFLFICLV